MSSYLRPEASASALPWRRALHGPRRHRRLERCPGNQFGVTHSAPQQRATLPEHAARTPEPDFFAPCSDIALHAPAALRMIRMSNIMSCDAMRDLALRGAQQDVPWSARRTSRRTPVADRNRRCTHGMAGSKSSVLSCLLRVCIDGRRSTAPFRFQPILLIDSALMARP